MSFLRCLQEGVPGEGGVKHQAPDHDQVQNPSAIDPRHPIRDSARENRLTELKRPHLQLATIDLEDDRR